MESNHFKVSDESTDETETLRKCLIEDFQENSSKVIILNNRDVITTSGVEEKTKSVASNNPDVDNELAVSNENSYLGFQRKRPIDDVVQNKEISSKAIVLNDRDVVKIFNTNSLSNLYFSRSIMFFSSPVYNKYGTPWYGLPKERKYYRY